MRCFKYCGIGAVLSSILPDGIERPITFISKILSDAERNYSVVVKDALAIFLAKVCDLAAENTSFRCFAQSDAFSRSSLVLVVISPRYGVTRFRYKFSPCSLPGLKAVFFVCVFLLPEYFADGPSSHVIPRLPSSESA